MPNLHRPPHQRSIKTPVSAVGLGLHSGLKVSMNLKPAAPGHGIVFYRVDKNPVVAIPALVSKIGDTRMASVLQEGDVRVSTVEHLLSACAGLGIDNLKVEVDAEEVPIMDGSAATFIYLFKEAGIVDLPAKKKFIRVNKVLEVRDDKVDKWARLSPFDGFKLDFFISFPYPKVNRTGQFFSVDLTNTPYADEIGRARTFGFVNDLETLRGMGLARGGSLENAIVMDEYDILNDGDMRYSNEFVRHKILDAIGDLYLVGGPLLGYYEGHRAGHAFNSQLLNLLLADSSNYDLV